MSKRKLLLADDSVTIQKVVNLTFADEGIEVISVGDGDSAMAKVVEISPDLVMADVNMPGLNGYQICEQIRQDETLRQTPVILLVGSFEPFDEDEARRVGADDFLTKPFQSIRQLVNKVTVLLNSENAQNGHSTDSTDAFEDTLEMEPVFQDVQSGKTAEYEDSGFDDEMIQASQFTGYALDESPKFETKSTASTEEEDLGKTQPLTNEEIKEFELVETPYQESFSQTEENIEDFNSNDSTENNETEEDNGEIEAEEEIEEIETEETLETISKNLLEDSSPSIDEPEEIISETDQIAETIEEDTVEIEPESPISVPDEITESQEDEIPLPEVASVLESDEDDLLELPPIETDSEDDLEDEVIESQESVGLAQNEVVTGNTEQISSELIEAIANRVMEKLSDKAVKEVAWEVVPQMTELIVKKMAEEKLKE